MEFEEAQADDLEPPDAPLDHVAAAVLGRVEPHPAVAWPLVPPAGDDGPDAPAGQVPTDAGLRVPLVPGKDLRPGPFTRTAFLDPETQWSSGLAQELKGRLKATWMAGDFGLIAKSYESGAAEFVRRLGFVPGIRVLDVACGTGNLAVPAARTGAEVTGVDIATNLLDQGRTRAAAEGLKTRFDEGNAEKLPYPDASFDAVISMFGVMFAPRPELAAAECSASAGRAAGSRWRTGPPAGSSGRCSRRSLVTSRGRPVCHPRCSGGRGEGPRAAGSWVL